MLRFIMCNLFYCKSILVAFGIFLSLFSARTFSWKPTAVPRDVFVGRFVIWRHRAFFAIPRWRNESNSLELPSTLVETFWHDRSSEIVPSTPSVNVPVNTYIWENRCESLRSVTDLDVDPRGRLWILDAPTEPHCPAKVVVYDLKRVNTEKITSIDLLTIPTVGLKVLIVDPVINSFEYRAYIGDPGDESIIVFSLGQRRWWKLNMARNDHLPHIYSTDLAISKRDSLLYMTGLSTDDLFSVNLAELRNCQGPPLGHADIESQEVAKINASWVGKKLGRSSGLFCDAKGGVHYFLTSEKASVRWDSRYELKAENHLILLQNETASCITDYAMDFQRNVWALVNSRCPSTSTPNVSTKSTIGPRIVKIFRYCSIL